MAYGFTGFVGGAEDSGLIRQVGERLSRGDTVAEALEAALGQPCPALLRQWRG
jgi:hypothetical protein